MEPIKSKKPSVQTILIAGFLVLILIAVGFGVMMMISIQKQNAALLEAQLNAQQQPAPVPAPVVQQSDDTGGKTYVVDENNVGDIMEKMEEEVDDGMFTTNMTTIWTFPEGDKAAENTLLANDASNHKPFVVNVTLDETGEVVYTSSVVPVGKQVKEIKLEKDLPAGTYTATCNYTMLDKEGKENGMFGVGITLVVQQ